MLLPTIRSLLDMFSAFDRVELCPIIKEFGPIMGEPKIDNLVFLDFPSLLQVVLGVPLAIANRWCILANSTLAQF